MPIRISQALLTGIADADVPVLEQRLWIGSGGACALCAEPMDRDDDELEAGRDVGGGLRLSHARCHHDVVGAADRARLEREFGDNPATYLKRRGWRKSRAKRVEPRVPLLRAGSERRWTWLVKGALADGSGVQLGCLALSFGGEGGEDHEGVFIEGDGEDLWTVVVLDADYPDIGFVTLTEHARELDWVADDSTRRRVALESAAFEQAVRLTLAAGGDELEVRARFTPVVQLALASRGIPFGDRYEADRGTVIVAREGNRSLDDLPELIDLLGDALWLRAVVAEDPPGRVPEREALRALVLEDEAER
ncbi:MAG: hypothetical protein NTX95_07415 [Actinobacteria bacterium]|nr:hypothetical protein [Actinomycetota bacterium]